MSRFIVSSGTLALLMIFAGAQAHAIPVLQLYIEGATYNTETESWEISPPGSSGGAPFRLWAIGNVAGPGAKGDIMDVRLSAAYPRDYSDIVISLTPTLVGGSGAFQGIDDPSVAGPAVPNAPVRTSKGMVPGPLVTNGGSPVLGSGKPLPSHGIFGEDTVWREFSLGDFTLTDSSIGDFIGAFPTELAPGAGQINAYEVAVTGGHGATIHFDLYDTVMSGNHSKVRFAPFSHDADAEANVIPEPSSIVVWSLLLVAAIGVGRLATCYGLESTLPLTRNNSPAAARRPNA